VELNHKAAKSEGGGGGQAFVEVPRRKKNLKGGAGRSNLNGLEGVRRVPRGLTPGQKKPSRVTALTQDVLSLVFLSRKSQVLRGSKSRNEEVRSIVRKQVKSDSFKDLFSRKPKPTNQSFFEKRRNPAQIPRRRTAPYMVPEDLPRSGGC